ncbi:MAG: hypothetical protein BroJett029_10200 [Alphaproteobacteria bacterium]|nr:MAG: hypothetical protein BroJett029_10200 [Alphaproteobacteria bacterium]
MLIRIGKTDAIMEPPTLREGRASGSIENLFEAFHTDVFVEADSVRHFRVGSFAMLYGLLDGICALYERQSFAIQDDDFLLVGEFSDQGCTIMVSEREVKLGTFTVGETVVWMAGLVSELANSISAETADFQAYLRAHPPAFSYR